MALTVVSIVDDNDKYHGITFEFSVHTLLITSVKREILDLMLNMAWMHSESVLYYSKYLWVFIMTTQKYN